MASVRAAPSSSPGERVSLESWAHEGAVSEPLSERMMAHPAFAAAARTMAQGMLDIADADPRVSGIFKDAGRYVAALLAIHLDLQGGLTLPRLKAFCEQTGFISPGRARALLLYLRFLRYVEPAPAGAAKGPQRHVPTPSFRAAWRVQSCAALEGAAVVEPAARVVSGALDRPAVFEAFVRAHTAHLIENALLTDQDSAFARTLMHKNAGNLLSLLLIAGEDTSFPPRRAVSLAAAAAARRFGVSRIHVRRLLDGAVEAGALMRSDDGAIAFGEASRDAVRLFYAQQLVVILAAAAVALPAADAG